MRDKTGMLSDDENAKQLPRKGFKELNQGSQMSKLAWSAGPLVCS